MALIVEDGTGLATAESYISVTDAELYVTKIYGTSNAAWVAATEAIKEQALRQSARYIDGRFTFVGIRLTLTQALEWPRSGAYKNDGSYQNYDLSHSGFAGGQLIEGVPTKIEEASVELAILVINGTSLFPVTAAGGDDKRVTVGPITIEKSENMINREPIFHLIEALMKFLIVTNNRLERS